MKQDAGSFNVAQECSLGNGAKDVFRLYLSNTKMEIESELSKRTSGLSGLNLHPQIEYAVLSGGKRLRPLLVILSTECVGGDRNKVMSLALGFEFIHAATLVHDDIIDQEQMRRGKPALYRKWSLSDAILTGDVLIALAVDLACGYGKTILKTVAKCALELCEGEHTDVAVSLETMTEKAYFRRTKEKSASLFRAATYCGALVGNGRPSEVRSLSVFGENLGIAYQLKDDLLDLTLKESTELKDLKKGRISLPIIHSYTIGNPHDRKAIETKVGDLMKQARNNERMEGILDIILRNGSLEYCEKKIDQYIHQAISSISELRDSEYKAYLVEMAESLKNLS